MPRKISDKTQQLMQRLYARGLTPAEIARRTNVSYPTAYGYTKAKERGFASPTEYENYLAGQRGFASLIEYQEDLAGQRGFASRAEYQKHLARQRGFASQAEYEDCLARQRGFASLAECQKYLAKERQQKSINRELSRLIQQRLSKLEHTQRWLAEQLGITEGAVSRYISGKTTPRKSLQKRLFDALELPYQTLDDIFKLS